MIHSQQENVRRDRTVDPADILLLNANTNTAMTEKMVDAARGLHPNCRGATVTRGSQYISDQDSALLASNAVAEFAAHLGAETMPNAIVIACFGDPGLWTVRDQLSIPVIGMAEASFHVACQMGRRFAIVTGGAAWEPMLKDFVELTGLSSRASGIYTLDQTGDVLAADPHYALPFIAKKVDLALRDGADVVILGGAGMVGFADRLSFGTKLPVLDSLKCAVSQAVAVASV